VILFLTLRFLHVWDVLLANPLISSLIIKLILLLNLLNDRFRLLCVVLKSILFQNVVQIGAVGLIE
jgi:hypothetical protein